ncbi:hypothetical protein QFZ83_006474 [Variovorax sp. W1I1]|uniref:hypothetical protein n=1 Tax=Variovorax sp. W1I1 TaxID=3042309 RepID=UPI00277F41FB|nr:hypothetical protein [Variovorax sp. W1I1]MDQ0612303.1 hypothetical protein [Variovorax sp. W1I1]
MNRVEELLEIMIDQVVLPALLELDKESNQPIAVKVSAIFGNDSTSREICTRAGESTNTAGGEARIRFRESSPANCFSFAGEAIFNGLAPATGFSGFAIAGKLKVDERMASLSSRSNRYNVWTWSKGFVV